MSTAISCVVLGGGGHAAVVIDAMLAGKGPQPFAILDADPNAEGSEVLGVLVRGDDSSFAQLTEEGATFFVVGLGSVADGQPRRQLFEQGIAAGLSPLTVIHPGAVVSPSSEIGAGTIILAGAVVNARSRIGDNVIINTGAIVEHDCEIDDHAHICPRACLGGDVRVGEIGHIGIGAVVKQGINIGAGAIVGAGSVVTGDVETGMTVTGVPARAV